MLKSCVLATFLASVLLGCPPGPAPVPVPDADAASIVDASVTDAPVADAPQPPKSDATPSLDAAPLADAALPAPDASLDACALAQANLEKLKCKDARGQLIARNKNDAGFADTCRYDSSKGLDVKPVCIAVAKDCAGVMSCGIR